MFLLNRDGVWVGTYDIALSYRGLEYKYYIKFKDIEFYEFLGDYRGTPVNRILHKDGTFPNWN